MQARAKSWETAFGKPKSKETAESENLVSGSAVFVINGVGIIKMHSFKRKELYAI